MVSIPFLGVFFHWLGGLASGSFYVPYRGVKKWSWETYRLVVTRLKPEVCAAVCSNPKRPCCHPVCWPDDAASREECRKKVTQFMKANTLKIHLSVCLCQLGLALTVFAAPTDPLATSFQHPPASAQPWVYWFPLSGNFIKAGITADLEAMARIPNMGQKP